jgi:NAD(P)H-flavin reductase
MQWYDSKIIRIAQESPQTRRFWLKIEGSDLFQFKAGQFVTMDLPISDRRTKRWRSYSIANAPDGSNVLEFCIVRLEGGLGTTYLFEEAKLGGNIKFKGPDGGFTITNSSICDINASSGGYDLRFTISNPASEPSETALKPKIEPLKIVMICTGTGVAPFRSMIGDIINRGISDIQVHLIFGTRTEADVLYRAEFEHYTTLYSWFRYDIALSRESDWPGHKGHVHPIYMEEYKIVRPNTVFYVCGWSRMVDEAVANLLTELHYDRKQVKFELYG